MSFKSEKLIDDLKVTIQCSNEVNSPQNDITRNINPLEVEAFQQNNDRVYQYLIESNSRLRSVHDKIVLLLDVGIAYNEGVAEKELNQAQSSIFRNMKGNNPKNSMNMTSLMILAILNDRQVKAFFISKSQYHEQQLQQTIRTNPADGNNLLLQITSRGEISEVLLTQPLITEIKGISGVQLINITRLRDIPEDIECSIKSQTCWITKSKKQQNSNKTKDYEEITANQTQTSNILDPLLEKQTFPENCLNYSNLQSQTSPLHRILFPSQNTHFSLVSSQENEVVVNILQPFVFLLPMYDVFDLEVTGLEYDKVMYVKNYAYVKYKFVFTQLVPTTATAVFTLKYPLKMQPNPTELSQLQITFQASFQEDTSATEISSVFSKIVKYSFIVSNYAFILAMIVSKSHCLQSIIFLQQGQQLITSFNEFPASDPLRDYFEQIYSSHFNINPSSTIEFYIGKHRFLPQNSTNRFLATSNQFYPKNEQLTLTSFEVNTGLYALLGIALMIGLILCIFATSQKYRHWLEQIKIIFRFQVFLAIFFLCYFGTCEDAIFRFYHSVYRSSMEQIINYFLLLIVVLYPLYMIPIVYFCEKENHSSNVGMLPFSYLYMNVIINSKKIYYLYVPIRLLGIFLSALIRCFMMSGLPYFLLGYYFFLILFLWRYKPHKIYFEYVTDMVNSYANIVQILIIIIVSRQDMFKENIRSGISQGFVYLSFLLIGFNVAFGGYRIAKAYQEYVYERDFNKKVMPVETFLPQTKIGLQKHHNRPRKEQYKKDFQRFFSLNFAITNRHSF